MPHFRHALTLGILGTTRFLLSDGRYRRPKKIGGLDTEDAGKAVHDVDTGRMDASFKRTDVGPVNSCIMRELFLRQALCAPKFYEVDRQNLSDVHLREGIDLKSISPRSILYKIALSHWIDAEFA
jgi:hypothetical protein